MFLQYFVVFWLAGGITGAPALETNPLLTPQYVVLTSPALAHHQIQYNQPLVKLQQPFFQQITPLGRFETPQKQNLVVLYPNGPLTQYPLLSLRQDGGSGGNEFLQGVQNFFQYIQSLGGPTESPAPPATEEPTKPTEDAATKLETSASLNSNNAGPLLQSQPLTATKLTSTNQLLPASTELLADRRYFILSSQPQAQFFGKYDALTSPLNTVYLQPLQTIQSRSAEPLSQPEALPAAPILDSPIPLANPQESAPEYNLNQRPDGALSLRSSLEQPPQPARINLQRDDSPREASRVLPIPEDDEQPEEQSRDLAEGRAAESAEQSIAQAKPTGIALAGKGGVASAKPTATALVGDRGLALAAPAATAISGDLSDEEKAALPGRLPLE